MRFNNKKSYQRFLLLVIVVTLLFIAASAVGQEPNRSKILPSPEIVSIPNSPESQRQQAAHLTAQGHEQLNRGNPEAALRIWGQALNLYQHINYSEGIAGSQINRSLAWLALGHDRQACTMALSAMQLDTVIPLCRWRDHKNSLSATEQRQLEQALANLDPSLLNSLGLRVASESLRNLGEIEVAKSLITQGLLISKTLQVVPEIIKNHLSLVKLETLFYRKNREIAERQDNKRAVDRQKVIDAAQQILVHYQEIDQLINSQLKRSDATSDAEIDLQIASPRDLKTLKHLAFISQLSFLVEYEQWLNANQVYLVQDQEERQLLPLVQKAKQTIMATLINTPDLFSDMSAIAAFHARLSFAKSLLSFQSNNNDLANRAVHIATAALALAQHLENLRLTAIAYNELGNLYQAIGHLSQAITYTEQGLQIAQSLDANEITFQAQHRLGKLYRKMGNLEAAIAAYNAAIVDLERIRKDIIYNRSEFLFSFREKVEPVYRELISLYLEQTPKPAQKTLHKIIEINRNFQQVELENFLNCGLYTGEEKRFLENEVNSLSDAIIYLIKSEELQKLLVIVKRPQQDLIAHIVNWHDLKPSINLIKNNLNSANLSTGRFSNSLSRNLDILYQAVFQPIRAYLPPSGNLIFVIDSDLQGISLALLQDEHDRYLIEDYSIAYVPGSYIRPLNVLNLKRHQALLAGAAEGAAFRQDNLPNLNSVETEIQSIQSVIKSKSILLNQNFTASELQSRLYNLPIAILHIATHGQFSSDSTATKLWTYDQTLNLADFDRLLRTRTQNNRVNLELLVLSACETAKDDRRGGLGLAGVAIQAGARSTVASLWKVDDQSTALLMKQFYRSLSRGATRTVALRDAQLALLRNPDRDPDWQAKYQDPYYWAAFILLGSWT